jgi:hypothetical protein
VIGMAGGQVVLTMVLTDPARTVQHIVGSCKAERRVFILQRSVKYYSPCHIHHYLSTTNKNGQIICTTEFIVQKIDAGIIYMARNGMYQVINRSHTW